jgi:uncharacterized protein (TIGR03435 family)
MKKSLLLLFAVASCPVATLLGQTFTGTWQGTLKIPRPPGELRIVFQITSADKGTLQADMYSVDQPGQHTKYVSVTQSGSTIRMTLAGPNGNYDGRLSLDGSTLTVTGDWDLGAPTAVILTKATRETAWTIPEPPPPLAVMDAKAKPEFEVATIKPSEPNRTDSAYIVNKSGMLITNNLTLADLIKYAYNVHPRQISGAPAWVESDKFDITAKPDTPGMPNGDQLATMVQKLLKDRFGLTFHREKRDLNVYVITVAKGGPKIAKADPSPLTLPAFYGRSSRGRNARNATIANFAEHLQSFLDRPVVDQTGLGDQRYNFVLKWTLDPAQLPPNAQPQTDADAPPDLFTAMAQQLGLQMKSVKAPVEVIVVDKVEKPSAN